MLDQEREVRRLSGGKANAAAVACISTFVGNCFVAIGFGSARFDVFGRLGFVARIGPEPMDVNMDKALWRRHEQIAPMIENIVCRTLPWLLSRDITQTQLPL
ncbi:MAG: hypothetical protein NTY01_20320 [Verrucomicrobia bacterium]|nr:hypothetical protein [Verrucomicrobiota bacterium]